MTSTRNFLYLIFGVALAVAPATADIYTLTSDQCTGGCGTSPFGTITVTQDGIDTVKLLAALTVGDSFVHTGFPGALGFDVSGNPTVSVSNLTTGYSLVSPTAGSLHFSAFGYLGYAIDCIVCGYGASNPQAGPISFDLTAAGLTPASFKLLSSGGSVGAYFVADIIGTTGNTGVVGATGAPILSAAPEPSAIILFGTCGMLAVFGIGRRMRAGGLEAR